VRAGDVDGVRSVVCVAGGEAGGVALCGARVCGLGGGDDYYRLHALSNRKNTTFVMPNAQLCAIYSFLHFSCSTDQQHSCCACNHTQMHEAASIVIKSNLFRQDKH
jgi:hypothetical protein